MRKRRQSEGFNLAFLDIMACGLGAVVLVFMLVKHNVSNPAVEVDLLAGDLRQLELQQDALQQVLDDLRESSQFDFDKTASIKAELVQLRKSLAQKERSLKEKKDLIEALKQDISATPVAAKEDLLEDDRGGEEDYLMGLKVEGSRIVLLVDSSSSMTDETLIEIIKRKNGPDMSKKQGPKWLRTRKIVRWFLARTPRTSRVAVVYFNDSVKSKSRGNWSPAGDAATLKTLYSELDAIVPTGGTNLQKGLKAAAKYGPTDLYVITDGLPTVGDSRYGGLNPFASCSSLLGKSSTISGECRVKLFRQTVQDSSPQQSTINVVLLPIEGDPDAVNEFWHWAAPTGGLVISPAANWP
ncbi:MAG: VWA domain-containing protein [Desulforhopalus sp.]